PSYVSPMRFFASPSTKTPLKLTFPLGLTIQSLGFLILFLTPPPCILLLFSHFPFHENQRLVYDEFLQIQNFLISHWKLHKQLNFLLKHYTYGAKPQPLSNQQVHLQRLLHTLHSILRNRSHF